MDHQTHQHRTRFIWLYFEHIIYRPSYFNKCIVLGKVERKKRRGTPTSKRIDSITVAMNALLRPLKDQIGYRWSWRKPMWSLRLKLYLIVYKYDHNQQQCWFFVFCFAMICLGKSLNRIRFVIWIFEVLWGKITHLQKANW